MAYIVGIKKKKKQPVNLYKLVVEIIYFTAQSPPKQYVAH